MNRCSECQNPAGQCCEPGQAAAYAARAEQEYRQMRRSVDLMRRVAYAILAVLLFAIGSWLRAHG